MRIVLQRVTEATVRVDGAVVGNVGPGLCLLVGVERSDSQADARAAVAKIVELRVFPDDEGKMNRSLLDVGGSVLVVSQFTLLGNVTRGRRPSFADAADPDIAEPLVASMVDGFESAGVRAETGVFGAMMEVALTNHGPVTLSLQVSEGRVS